MLILNLNPATCLKNIWSVTSLKLCCIIFSVSYFGYKDHRLMKYGKYGKWNSCLIYDLWKCRQASLVPALFLPEATQNVAWHSPAGIMRDTLRTMSSGWQHMLFPSITDVPVIHATVTNAPPYHHRCCD